MEVTLGLMSGFLLGFFLQRGRILRFETQIGFLRLIDRTMLKFMLSALVTGMVGWYCCYELGLVALNVQETVLGAQMVGAVLFGVGWGLGGFCPAMAAGALGEGRIHALWALLGMMAGAALYAEAYPELKDTLLSWGNVGPFTVPQLLGIGHWPLIGCVVLIAALSVAWMEMRRQ